ncbi:MAG: DUF2779 domain-containing protein, partial [Thermodesulfovibrionales bacterium]|nr:DUF2779 domain-containing protein [Thermodesulfovibrionales bacterium]
EYNLNMFFNSGGYSMNDNVMKDVAYLSKTLFIKGLQCHKALYLHKYHPELKDEISEVQQALFRSGTDVGVLARQLFPGGVEIPYEGLSLSDQVRRTQAEIEQGTATIYEAAFCHEGSFCKVDILNKGETGWEIYEVKSSTEIKDVYYDDVAFQYYVLKGAGLAVSRVSLVYINNQYVKSGDIDVNELFTSEDMTANVVETESRISVELTEQRAMLAGGMPEIDIGRYCRDPYDCDFIGHCWSHIPENSVFDLRERGIDKFDLYRQGILDMRDIPEDMLNFKQGVQVEGTLHKKDHIIKDNIRDFLQSFWYPACFLDFETFMSPIPLFDGTRPYQQIPFQYSLHYMEIAGSRLRHTEFLAAPDSDPRKELTDKLMNEIPGDACVIAYNMAFEKRILRDLASWFPEYNERIEHIISNMRDLMAPFRAKDCYLWQMNGSYSIKAVLPALVPEMSYEGMEISDGGMAMNAYSIMCATRDPAELDRIRKALCEYCSLDTLGMVRIVEKLREFSK